MNMQQKMQSKGYATWFSFFPELTRLIRDLPLQWLRTRIPPLDKLPDGQLQQIALAVRLSGSIWQGDRRTNKMT